MAEIRWMWNDTGPGSPAKGRRSLGSPAKGRISGLFGSPAKGQAKPPEGFLGFDSMFAFDSIAQLERQSLKDKRRPVYMMLRGKEHVFENVEQAISFLRPHADKDRIVASKQRQHAHGAGSSSCEVLPPEARKARVRKALYCASDHPNVSRTESSSMWTMWLQRPSCQVCLKTVNTNSLHWRCGSGCDYSVCNVCFQDAVGLVADAPAERSPKQSSPALSDRCLSDTSTCVGEGPSSDGSNAEGPRVELLVDVGGRREICTFDARPLDVQLLELADAVDSRHGDASASFLVSNCGSDFEILHSEMQLQTLVPHALVSMERADTLVSRCLDKLRSVNVSDVACGLRHLHALVSAGDSLVGELIRQGSFLTLIDVIRSGGDNIELACSGICALLQHADSRPEARTKAMSTLRENWFDSGSSIISSLLEHLFARECQPKTPASVFPTATLAVALRLLEEIAGAAATAHDVSQGGHKAKAGALYPVMVSDAQSNCSGSSPRDQSHCGFYAHAGYLVLCSMLRASTRQVARAELHSEIRQHIARHATSMDLLEDLCSESGVAELLKVLTACSAAPAALELQKRQEEAARLREEKKFSAALQESLRQTKKALLDMLRLVQMSDPKTERELASVITHGWDSVDWPDGYTLLHFLCEHTDHTDLVRLVAGLCSDLETCDAKGKRPFDYALDNSREDLARCIVEVAQERVANGLSSHRSDNHVVRKEPVFAAVLHADNEYFGQTGREIKGDTLCSSNDQVAEAKPEEEEVTPKGPCPDPAHVGTVYMMKTELDKMTKENHHLRQKNTEMEMIRTRLAKLTEENEMLENALREANRITPESVASRCVASQDKDGVKCDSVCEACPATSEDSANQAENGVGLETGDGSRQQSKGKTKGKGKGKQAVSDAAPVEALAEEASAVEPPVKEEEAPVKEEVLPKGKGKGKGKVKGPKPPEKENDGSSPPSSVQAKGKGKGKAAAVVEPTKPRQAPSKDLKSVPWTRFVKGVQLEEGTTIWDEVNKIFDKEEHMKLVPVHEIEERFSKNANDTAKVEKVDKKDHKNSKTVTKKLDSISQEQRLQMEVCLKTLPLSVNTGAKAANAIRDLNRTLCSADAVQALYHILCPTPEQQQELAMKRHVWEQANKLQLEADGDAKPEPFIWDPVEQYMEALSVVPACSMRLSCWDFLYNLPDRIDSLRDNLDRFEQMVHCFQTSQELPHLLSTVMAFGNFLNGGKNEKRLGQADGFHIEALSRPGGLDAVKDTKGRDVRELIFRVFFEDPERAGRLLLELGPLFSLVQRRVPKDGSDLNKSVRVQIEDLDRQLVQVRKEFGAKRKELQEGLPLIEDPADKFLIEVPPEFERERKRVDELAERKDLILGQFKALLARFKAETYRGDATVVDGKMKDGNPKEPMTSEVWCKIWDDFFVVKSLVLGFDEKTQKEILEPRFCKDAPITVESLKIMWRFEDPKQLNSKKKQRLTASTKRHSV